MRLIHFVQINKIYTINISVISVLRHCHDLLVMTPMTPVSVSQCRDTVATLDPLVKASEVLDWTCNTFWFYECTIYNHDVIFFKQSIVVATKHQQSNIFWRCHPRKKFARKIHLWESNNRSMTWMDFPIHGQSHKNLVILQGK